MKTTLLLGLMTVLIIFIGGAVGGQGGMIMAFFLAGIMNLGSYWFSDKIVLAMYRAQEIAPQESSPKSIKWCRNWPSRPVFPNREYF